MSMQRLVLGVAFLFLSALVQETASQGNSGKEEDPPCYSKAVIPFGSKNDALGWVEEHCQCFEKVLACENNKCISDQWSFMHTNETVLVVDGVEIPHWRVWNARVQKGLHFMKDSSGYQFCGLVDWGPDYVEVNATIDFYYTMSVPVFGSARITYARVRQVEHITFSRDGTFARKEHITGGVFTNMFRFFGVVSDNARNAAASFVAATVPQSVAQSFSLADADSGIIVFVGCVALVMYLALMYTIVRVATLCIRGRGGARPGYEYGKVNDLLTSVTEIEDANEKQVLHA